MTTTQIIYCLRFFSECCLLAAWVGVACAAVSMVGVLFGA